MLHTYHVKVAEESKMKVDHKGWIDMKWCGEGFNYKWKNWSQQTKAILAYFDFDYTCSFLFYFIADSFGSKQGEPFCLILSLMV